MNMEWRKPGKFLYGIFVVDETASHDTSSTQAAVCQLTGVYGLTRMAKLVR